MFYNTPSLTHTDRLQVAGVDLDGSDRYYQDTYIKYTWNKTVEIEILFSYCVGRLQPFQQMNLDIAQELRITLAGYIAGL